MKGLVANYSDESDEDYNNDEAEKDNKVNEENTIIEKNNPIEKKQEHNNEEEDDDDDENDLEDIGIEGSGIPMSHLQFAVNHEKCISTIDIDSSGSRMLTGSLDYSIKLWDFESMDTGFRPFRSFIPSEGYPLREAKFSFTGNRILVCTSSSSAKLYDRDGSFLMEYAKGDPYIRDRRHTSGHIMPITGCDWHPTDGNYFMTSSMDGTVRIWGSSRPKQSKETIVIKSKLAKVKANVTTVKYSLDYLAVAALDGSLRLYNVNGPYVRPVLEKTSAHVADMEITSLAFSVSGKLLASRSMDNTMKVWDVRNFSKPLHEFQNLPNMHSETKCLFSPDDLHIATGTTNGSICLFNTISGEKVQEENVTMNDEQHLTCSSTSATRTLPHCSVVSLLWDKRLNQIFSGCSDGKLAMFYDPILSKRGVLSALQKKGKIKSAMGIVEAQAPIITPHSLPLFRESGTKNAKRKFLKDRKDPVKSRQPELPLSGAGKGGRVSESYTQHVMLSLNKNTMRDEDPREALLKHAKEAEENPIHIGYVYSKTQPKPVFQEGEFEEYEIVKRRK